jgi:hypothetical protein
MQHTEVPLTSVAGIRASLAKVGTSAECIICDSSDLGLVHDAEPSGSLVFANNEKGRSAETSTNPQAVIVCRDCGFTYAVIV